MSTNYFRPISYAPRRPTQTPPQPPPTTSASFTPQNAAWTSVTGWSPTGQQAAPNQGTLGRLVGGLYGSGTAGQPNYVPGLNERAATAFSQARTGAQNALRGYGGVSFRQDDPSTPNVDESLMMDYQPDQLGRNERQAVLAARAQANARGMLSSGFGDQLIGSALQRVGEEARAVVNQYSRQINEISDRFFDPLTGLVNTTLGQIEGLYGADARWAADQEGLRPPPPAAPAPAPAPQNSPTTNPGAVHAGESMVWRGERPPNLNTLRERHPDHTLRVVFVQGGGSDGAHYRVIAVPK